MGKYYGQHNAHRDWISIMKGTSSNLAKVNLLDYVEQRHISNTMLNQLRRKAVGLFNTITEEEVLKILTQDEIRRRMFTHFRRTIRGMCKEDLSELIYLYKADKPKKFLKFIKNEII